MSEEIKEEKVVVTEVKESKKKFFLSDTLVIVLLSVFVIANFFGMALLFSLEESVKNASVPIVLNTEELRDDVKNLKLELLDLKRNTKCEKKDPLIDDIVKTPVGVGIRFYDEYRDPIEVPSICTDCKIREAGEVIGSSPYVDELVGLKYLIIRTEEEGIDYTYFTTNRILANSDYSKLYYFEDFDNYYFEMNPNDAYVTKYAISLLTNLLPDEIGNTVTPNYTEYFKSKKGLHFRSIYDPYWGGENELTDIEVEQFDTYKDIPIYVNRQDTDFYYVKSNEHFLAILEYIPSLSIREANKPYPITWDGEIANTDNYSYGYDACGSYGLREVDVEKADLKITGYKTGTEQPIYEHINTQNFTLKKMYEEDYLTYIYPYEDNPNNAPALTYEQFLARHPIIFWEDEIGRLVMFYNVNFEMVGGCAKPIVYLYPEREMSITVKVLPSTGALTFTYPKYNEKWEVVSDKNSCIKDKDGNKYEYLWWESTSKYLPEIRDGFVVKYDTLGVFFDLILSNAGFNYKEIKDFKEFWIPTMTGEYSPYFKIHFLQNEDVDIVADLQIHPQPTTEIRIFMIYERLNTSESIKTQEIDNTQRKGFTVTEWGGTRR